MLYSVIIYFFNLLEILVDIINHKHYLVTNAKYHSSKINNAYTMSPANMSATP